ncbi:unnamed protein product [Clavelina lepadiformis]|uniref:Uncharacterized protein n=1 Tax=Clavelina lepadiformis TaxID=159417 RepID=A0ABP0FLL6_CLALP
MNNCLRVAISMQHLKPGGDYLVSSWFLTMKIPHRSTHGEELSATAGDLETRENSNSTSLPPMQVLNVEFGFWFLQ